MKPKALRRVVRQIMLFLNPTRPLPRMKKSRGNRRYWRKFDQTLKWPT